MKGWFTEVLLNNSFCDGTSAEIFGLFSAWTEIFVNSEVRDRTFYDTRFRTCHFFLCDDVPIVAACRNNSVPCALNYSPQFYAERVVVQLKDNCANLYATLSLGGASPVVRLYLKVPLIED